jgi:hypothetical protein
MSCEDGTLGYWPSPDDVIASDPATNSGPSLISPPTGWPKCFSTNAKLKALMGKKALAGKRCRLTGAPSEDDLSKVSTLPLSPEDSFGNAEAVQRALGWEVVKGFAVYEIGGSNGGSFVGHKRWWNQKETGDGKNVWFDPTPRPDGVTFMVLLESSVATKTSERMSPSVRALARERLMLGGFTATALAGVEGREGVGSPPRMLSATAKQPAAKQPAASPSIPTPGPAPAAAEPAAKPTAAAAAPAAAAEAAKATKAAAAPAAKKKGGLDRWNDKWDALSDGEDGEDGPSKQPSKPASRTAEGQAETAAPETAERAIDVSEPAAARPGSAAKTPPPIASGHMPGGQRVVVNLTIEELQAAVDDLLTLRNLPGAMLVPRRMRGDGTIVDICAGWLDPATLPKSDEAVVRKIMRVVRRHSREALLEAIRLYLAPKGTYEEATKATATDWTVCKEIYAASEFLAAKVPREALDRLSDPTHLPSREEWKQTFGLERLRRPTRWRDYNFELGSDYAAQVARLVKAAGGRIDRLSTRQVLQAAAPMTKATADGWGSPAAWFCQGCVHFSDVLTVEYVRALAEYLARRAAEVKAQQGKAPTIVEIGAGNGRLSHFLNATGLFKKGTLIATDPTPLGSKGTPESLQFPVMASDDRSILQALDRHGSPCILVSNYMTFGTDQTPLWRSSCVAEYVLIGELGRRPRAPSSADAARASHLVSNEQYNSMMGNFCYSLNMEEYEVDGYERVLLEEVSREMIHIADLERGDEEWGGEAADDEKAGFEAVAAAVAFRQVRKGSVSLREQTSGFMGTVSTSTGRRSS